MRSAVLAALAVAILTPSCSESVNSTGTISKRIGDAARQPDVNEIDLGSLTTFGWDRVYVFKPAATREEMCRFLGANRNVCGRVIRVDRTPEGHVAMVFDLRGQVTHFEFHAFNNGRFDASFGENGIPRAAAVFKVRRSTGTNEVWLESK